jgi:hypothetical protein
MVPDSETVAATVSVRVTACSMAASETCSVACDAMADATADALQLLPIADAMQLQLAVANTTTVDLPIA